MNTCPDTGMHRSSVVLTLPSSEMPGRGGANKPAFNAAMQQRFADRLGRMTLASTRHVYPLVAVYPKRLVGRHACLCGRCRLRHASRYAHGFNLGLKSVEALAAELQRARRLGRNPGRPHGAGPLRAHPLAGQPPHPLATQLVAGAVHQRIGPRPPGLACGAAHRPETHPLQAGGGRLAHRGVRQR